MRTADAVRAEIEKLEMEVELIELRERYVALSEEANGLRVQATNQTAELEKLGFGIRTFVSEVRDLITEADDLSKSDLVVELRKAYEEYNS